MDYLYALIIFASGYVLGWLLCYASARHYAKKYYAEMVKADYGKLIDNYQHTVMALNKALRDVANQRDAALRIVRAHDEMDRRISMN